MFIIIEFVLNVGVHYLEEILCSPKIIIKTMYIHKYLLNAYDVPVHWYHKGTCRFQSVYPVVLAM